MGSLGFSVFITTVRESYKLRFPTLSVKDYQKTQTHSYATVADELLRKDPKKIERIKNDQVILTSLQQVVVQDAQPAALQEASLLQSKSDETVINVDMLKKILNYRVENNKDWENSVHKHIHCTATFLAQIGSHFMECLLVKAYDNPDLFNFNEFSADNIFIVLLVVIALYNGYQSFKENQLTYEKKAIDNICEAFVSQFRV